MHLSCPLPLLPPPHTPCLPFTLRPWWKDTTVVMSGHISAMKNQICQTGRVCIRFFLLQLLSISSIIRPSAFPPPAPLRSSTCLPPTISLSLACTSSGHGSLSRLQRGSAWIGDLSYFPSPLHDTQTQTHAYRHFLAMTKLQTCFWLLFPGCV